jgi:hypothetical protein
MIFLPDGEIMQVRSERRHASGESGGRATGFGLSCPPSPGQEALASPIGDGGVRPPPYGAAARGKLGEDCGRPFPDWKVTTDADWGFAILADEPKKGVLEPEKAHAFGKGEPAAHVLAKAAKIIWPMDGASCANVPIMPAVTEEDICTVKLVPYGSTCLRISQFPMGVIKTKTD